MCTLIFLFKNYFILNNMNFMILLRDRLFLFFLLLLLGYVFVFSKYND